MKMRALQSFCGRISMHKGEVKEINNKDLIKDLAEAGYIEPESKRGMKNEGKRDNTKGHMLPN